jgi:hypothetical protein
MSTAGEYGPVEVTRRIEASAQEIFAILADPVRHLDLDGSGMLRGAVTTEPVTRVGDAFVMRMFFEAHGDYQMINHIVEFEPDRLISWEPQAGQGHPSQGAGRSEERWGHRWSYQLTPDGPDATIVTQRYDCSRVPQDDRIGMRDGAVWIDAMTATLKRLDALCVYPR